MPANPFSFRLSYSLAITTPASVRNCRRTRLLPSKIKIKIYRYISAAVVPRQRLQRTGGSNRAHRGSIDRCISTRLQNLNVRHRPVTHDLKRDVRARCRANSWIDGGLQPIAAHSALHGFDVPGIFLAEISAAHAVNPMPACVEPLPIVNVRGGRVGNRRRRRLRRRAPRCAAAASCSRAASTASKYISAACSSRISESESRLLLSASVAAPFCRVPCSHQRRDFPLPYPAAAAARPEQPLARCPRFPPKSNRPAPPQSFSCGVALIRKIIPAKRAPHEKSPTALAAPLRFSIGGS